MSADVAVRALSGEEAPTGLKEKKRKKEKGQGKKRKREEEPPGQKVVKTANTPPPTKKSRSTKQKENGLSLPNIKPETPSKSFWPEEIQEKERSQEVQASANDGPPPKKKKSSSKHKEKVATSLSLESGIHSIPATLVKPKEGLLQTGKITIVAPTLQEKKSHKKNRRHEEASLLPPESQKLSSAKAINQSKQVEEAVPVGKTTINSAQPTEKPHLKKDKHKEVTSSSSQIPPTPSESLQTQDDEALDEYEEAATLPPSKGSQSRHKKKTASSVPVPSLTPDIPEWSPFLLQTFSLYLALSPISQSYPLQGLCAEHLSPLLLTYYPPFRGVVLSHSNARLAEEPGEEPKGKVLAQSIDEYAAPFVWVTADFLIFRPRKGGWIEGWVNLQNEDHLGLVCWNLFSASIERKRLSSGWRWIHAKNSTKKQQKKAGANGMTNGIGESIGGEDEADGPNYEDGTPHGYYEDENGEKVEGRVRFRVLDIETSMSTNREKSFLSIEGSMLTDEEEKELEEQRALDRTNGAWKSKQLVKKVPAESASAEALTNGVRHEVEQGNAVDKRKKGKGKSK
ncbi:MAG: hypothetical protein MMC33_003018 [Icmadophila ericetorum]|nr:hypothetical protein [Icmadophila ericetorum]